MAVWKSCWPVLAFLFGDCKYDASEKPFIVKYNTGDVLNVKLELNNVPEEFSHYDYKIRTVGSNQRPSLYENDALSTAYPISIRTAGLKPSHNNVAFEVLLSSSTDPYTNCNKQGNRRFILLQHSKHNIEEKDFLCLSKTCTITMDWGQYCDRKPIQRETQYIFEDRYSTSERFEGGAYNATVSPPNFQKHDKSTKLSIKPKVTPESFVDTGSQVMVFDCSAEGKQLGMLIWYQVKKEGGKETKPDVLKVYQEYQKLNTTAAAVTLNLRLSKTLEPSDHDSEIYCAYAREGEGESKSERIKIAFKTTVEPLEQPYLTVSPSTNRIYFQPGDNISLVCDGSPPVDDRRRTWYLKDWDSPFAELPQNQSIDNVTKQNTLQLHLDESFHLKTVYCALEHHSYQQYRNSSYGLWRYGVVATSERITLSLFEETSGASLQTILLGSAAALAAVVLLILALVMLRRRKSVHTPKEDQIYEDNYASTQVTYAILDLKDSEATPPPSSEVKRSNYVEIIGSFQPKRKDSYL